MKPILFLALVTFLMTSCNDSPRTYKNYEEYPPYLGSDLGLTYTPTVSVFRIWSPIATAVTLHLYPQGDGGNRAESIPLAYTENGVWKVEVRRDLKGLFYTYQVQTESKTLDETPGIYAKAVGVNGRRAAVVDMADTNPDGWEQDQRPPLVSVSDAILYELHVRDYTIHPSAGNATPGKYVGLAQTGTRNPAGLATGIDHLKEMGITHVHLLPVFDYRSVNEAKLDSAQFNWGYDPQNYNVPDGSYSTNPFDPAVRIREFKQMVKRLHDAGIRVVMDVVYNHTGETEGSNFNREVPGYYYRHNEDGSYSDAAACGNETASERAMMRKFIIESCAWWVKEYHVDGFRFDLMGIHDIKTMNLLTDTLLKIEPTLIFYGEGWTAGKSPLPDSLRALKANTSKLKHFAAFSDDLRDGLKGSVFDEKAKGFVNGGTNTEASIRFGITAAVQHPQVDYSAVNYSKAPWAREPWQCINYVSCHDNHTLADKLEISGEGKFSAARLEKMDILANAIVLTSQGIPFLHAGEEMMRTKNGVENSFNRPDSINAINWNWKTQHASVVENYKKLIALRKAHWVFHMSNAEQVRNYVQFLPSAPGVIIYRLDGKAADDPWKTILVVVNGNETPVTVSLPARSWTLAYSSGSHMPANAGKTLIVEPLTLSVYHEQ